MADKEISALTAATALDGTELLHVLQGSNSRKAKLPIWQLAGSDHTAVGIWDQSVDGSSAAVVFTGLAGAEDILLISRDVTKATTGSLRLRLSINNGSSYYSTSGDYVSIGVTGVETNRDSAALFHSTAATAARSGIALIKSANVDGSVKLIESPNTTSGDDRPTNLFVVSTSPVDAVEISGSGGGNLTGGIIYCLARGLV